VRRPVCADTLEVLQWAQADSWACGIRARCPAPLGAREPGHAGIGSGSQLSVKRDEQGNRNVIYNNSAATTRPSTLVLPVNANTSPPHTRTTSPPHHRTHETSSPVTTGQSIQICTAVYLYRAPEVIPVRVTSLSRNTPSAPRILSWPVKSVKKAPRTSRVPAAAEQGRNLILRPK